MLQGDLLLTVVPNLMRLFMFILLWVMVLAAPVLLIRNMLAVRRSKAHTRDPPPCTAPEPVCDDSAAEPHPFPMQSSGMTSDSMMPMTTGAALDIRFGPNY